MNLLFQCMGITGSIMVLYGLLALAITRASSTFFWTLMVAGGAMVIVFLASALSKRPWATMKDLYASRSVRHGTNAALYTVIVLGIIGVANIMGQDFHKRWDLTENKVNTLSEQSVKVVKALKQPISVYAFMNEQNQTKAQLKGLFQSYRNESKNFDYKFVDPDQERPLAIKFSAQEGDVVLEVGPQNHLTRELTEQGITQSMIKLTKTDSAMVCFTQGHGEFDLAAADEEPRSLSGIKGGIENEGYQTKAVESIAANVPSECSVLVVAGPTEPFSESEALAIDNYLGQGGKGLFLLDPNIPNPKLVTSGLAVKTSGLEKTLEGWGATLGENFILQQHMQLFRGMQIGLTVYAQTYGDHPIADPMKGRRTVFQNVRSVAPAAGFDGTVVELISSAPEGSSWAETDVNKLFTSGQATVEDADIKGPVNFALAIEKAVSGDKENFKDTDTRLVVFGDGDFISNAMVRTHEFNFDLFLNTLNWLNGEIEQITIRPKQLRSSSIELQPEQSNMIFYIAIVGIPMLVLIFGMDLWWIRRRRG